MLLTWPWFDPSCYKRKQVQRICHNRGRQHKWTHCTTDCEVNCSHLTTIPSTAPKSQGLYCMTTHIWKKENVNHHFVAKRSKFKRRKCKSSMLYLNVWFSAHSSTYEVNTKYNYFRTNFIFFSTKFMHFLKIHLKHYHFRFFRAYGQP